MSTVETRGVGARPTIRTITVIATALFWLVATVPNIWDDSVSLPFLTDSALHVTAVYPGANGLRVGDQVDWAASSLTLRLELQGIYYAHPGESTDVPVIRDGKRSVVSIRAEAEPTTIWVAAIKRTAATIFVIVAAILLLLRPTKMLWGFYLFALGNVGGAPLFWERLIPLGPWTVGALVIEFPYSVLLPIGLWMFASRFPRDRSDGLRRMVDRATISAFAILTVLHAMSVFGDFSSAPMYNDETIPDQIATAIGLLCLLDAFFHLRADERQRLKWVAAGFIISVAATSYSIVIQGFAGGGGWPVAWQATGFTPDVLYGLQVIIAISVAYAVLRHKVLDVNFVISRALVYGVITSFIVGVFALIDWFFSKALEQQGVAVAAEAVAALGLGFSLNAIHKFVDGVIDRVLFRRRHLAERRLERAATGIHHVVDVNAVDEALTLEPLEALGLTSAAAFRRGSDGSFSRTLAVGWDGAATSISPSDPLVQGLHGERGVLRLREVRTSNGVMPHGSASPLLAVPLFVRHALDGFVLFGQHVSGEDFDSDEIRLLERLAVAAASTYDHLDAEAARREVARLTLALESARTDRA